MFRVGQMARICNVSTKTLRYYDSVGLFSPAQVDPETKYRYYGPDQILPLRRILFLRDLGLGLEIIRELVRSGAVTDAERLASILEERARDLGQEIVAMQALVGRIETALTDLRAPALLAEQPIVVKEVPPLKVVGLRRTIHVSDLPALFVEVHTTRKVRPTGHPICIYHNPEFDPEWVDAEALIPVEADEDQVLPGGSVAAIVHEEPTHDPGRSYEALWTWIEQRGFTVDGPPREIYLTDPTVGAEGRLVIEIQYPITN